jgi:hypothetical protein
VVVDQVGLWTVDLRVDHDGLTSAGPVRPPFPTGDVLGTAGGRFFVYVVPRGSPPLDLALPREASLPPPAAVSVSATLPPGLAPTRAHVTAMMPGFVLESADLPPAGTLAYIHDPTALAPSFPNLDVSPPADAIAISLFASGTGPGGSPTAAARVLALHGAELLNLPVAAVTGPRVWVTTDREGYRQGDTLRLSVHLAPGSTTERVDAYAGLLRPDASFLSLRPGAAGLTLAPTGVAPEAVARNTTFGVNFSGPVGSYTWGAADSPGSYTAYVVLVRAGQSPLDPPNWIAIDAVRVTLSP